jgi:hypothetical protein
VLGQVAPEYYLVRSLDDDEANSATVVPFSDMKSWRFFDSQADLEAWTEIHPVPTGEFTDGEQEDDEWSI